MRHAYGYCLLILLALLAFATPSRADERILDYHADIALAADGSMVVTERIRVRAEGDQIRRGIYRDFPTEYRDPLRNRYRVQFEVLSAERDGRPEPWHSQPQDNGVRVYLGDSAGVVMPGEHTYALRYRSNRQIGFFADHDELYWNVTGTGWSFPIDHASASVQLPAAVDASQLKASGYTGAQGSREQAFKAATETGGARYATTRALAPHEGLSILLAFPKGLIAAPDTTQRLRWLLSDNRSLLLGLGGLTLLWLYYGLMWIRYGRDPATGVRVAEYEPPDGDSPAALRYVRRMGFDNTCFTAAILGIAAKGGLTIDLDSGGTYSVTRSDIPVSSLTPDEQTFTDTLFADGSRFAFVSSGHQRVSQTKEVLEKALRKMYRKKFFATNTLMLIPGLVISLATLLTLAASNGGDAGFMVLWLTGWSFAVCFLFAQAWQATRNRTGAAVPTWFMAIAFGAGEVGGMIALGNMAGFAVLPVFIALVGTNIAFYYWMKAPTQAGAKLLDRIDGFRWYLGVAEKQELDSHYKPESRPELFAAYLPYAVALDVGNAWAKRFTEALSPAQMQQAQPTWYGGRGVGNFSSSNFASFGSGLAAGVGGAIASASVSPGSSSGFSSSSGGSGGGGGGGGGGGW